MKSDYLVIIDKPSKIEDWDLWDNKTVYVSTPVTKAIIYAASEQKAKEKCETLYKGFQILKVNKL